MTTRIGRHWVARMLQDPAFSARVKSRWARLKPVARQVISEIPAAAATLAPAAEARLGPSGTPRATWSGPTTAATARPRSSSSPTGSPADPVAEQQRGAARRHPGSAPRERARTVWVPVRLQSPATAAVDVSWTVQAGTATAGEDFVAGTGQASFAPGQAERYVPVAGPRRPASPRAARPCWSPSPAPPAASWWAHHRRPRCVIDANAR